MKKTLLFIATVVSLISCEHSYTENNKLTDKGRIIHASTYDATRTYLEEVENVYAHKWSSADILGVFDKTTAISRYLLIEGEDTTDGSFLQVTTPDEGKSLSKSYAVYPYSENNTVSADGVFNVSFPAEQVYNTQHPNSYGLGSNILVGIGENDNFNFKNACGFLEINLTGSSKVHEITLVGNNNEKIAGVGIVSYSGNNEPKVVMLPSSTTEVSIISEDGILLDPTKATPFVFALPPTEFKNGFTVKIQNCGEISTQRCINVQRNIITPMATIDCGMPYNEIWYTSTDGKVVQPTTISSFNVKIVSNTYNNGKGILKFEENIETIGNSAFKGCTNLDTITFSNNIVSIEAYAFYECRSLKNINIPDSVKEIGKAAFSWCTKMQTITIGEGITYIEDGAFHGCRGSLIIKSNIPDGRYNSGTYTGPFAGSYFDEIYIDGNASSIGKYAFYNCDGLKKITFSENIIHINNMAFYDCDALTEISLEQNISVVGTKAFGHCDKLSNVKLGKNITNLGAGAFYYCMELEEVSCTSITPPTLGGDAFRYNIGERYYTLPCKIYVPTESVEAYKSANDWKLYADRIIGYDFENDMVVE